MDLCVLVVCADQDSASLLKVALSEMGTGVEHTPSISRGMGLLDEKRFDAIVLDYRADQSSEEFLARMRQSNKNRDSLLIALVDEGFNARPVFGLGANFVLYRPLTAERTRLSLNAARSLMRRDRRRNPRRRVSSTANVSYPGAPELNATMVDLSDGGVMITTRNRLPKSGKVYFEFALPGQQKLVRLSGEVAWQDASGCSGIRFLDVPQASRRLIQAWLQQNSDGHTSSSMAPSLTIKAQPQSSDSKGPGQLMNASNRRGEFRLACKLGAEVYRLGSNVPNRCSLSDISEGGCYVEMPSPLAGQSGVEILVRTSDMKFKIKGQVLTTHPGFGMGVRFMFRDSAEREEILRLLAVLANGPSLDKQPL
jgi:c-di-GMP-binding flagellar brake protein YcgR